MTDVEGATLEFLRRADEVFEEYEKGYIDADVAVDVLSGHVDNLRDAVEN